MKEQIPQALQPWLYDSGSFMKRSLDYQLRPEVKVLRQYWQYPQEEERHLLGLLPRRYVFYRDVLIQHEERPLLFARSLMPQATLKGKGRELLHLGKRALGSVLFAYPDLKRSSFELRQYELAAYAPLPLWGRRSVFYFQDKQVLLSEVFLPGLIELL